MNMLGKISIFVLLVTLGLFIIDGLLFSIPGEECNCFDSMLADMECWAVCQTFAGGCSHYRAFFPGYCPEEDFCCTRTGNYCEDEEGDFVPRGGTCCTYCSTCGDIWM